MTLLEAIILGIVQGITEFIPVSSSGHLILASNLLGVNGTTAEINAIVVFLHIGTLFALIFHYRLHLKNLFNSIVRAKTREEGIDTITKLALGSLPPFFFGFLFVKIIESSLTRSSEFYLTSISLILAGSVFIIAPRFYKGKNSKTTKNLTYFDAFKIGIGQSFGVLYGISRSGVTITSSRLVGLNNKDSLDFAFLISIPITAGATVYSMSNHFDYLFSQTNVFISLTGTVTSFIAGYFAIAFLLKYLRKHDLNLFGFYCIFAGITSMIIYNIV